MMSHDLTQADLPPTLPVEGQQDRDSESHRVGPRDDRQQPDEPVVRARLKVQLRELYRQIAGRPQSGRPLLDRALEAIV